jgi:hypothetical protein
MNFQNYLMDAIDRVLGWDLPDESLADAVKAQASLMARINPEEIPEVCSDWFHVQSQLFPYCPSPPDTFPCLLDYPPVC